MDRTRTRGVEIPTQRPVHGEPLAPRLPDQRSAPDATPDTAPGAAGPGAAGPGAAGPGAAGPGAAGPGAPDLVRADEQARVVTAPRPVRRGIRVAAVAALVAVTAAGAAGWAVQQSAERARVDEATARAATQAARARVEAALAATWPGNRTAASATGPAAGAVSVAAYTGEHAAEVGELTEAADRAADTLWRSRHAGDAADELRAAVRHARALAKDSSATLAGLREARADLVGPAAAATAAEKAWRAAEAERRAAERAEALRLAQERQEAREYTQRDTGATPPSTRPTIPQGGLVCSGTGGTGASEASASSLGAAINAYRASLGLAQLAVVRSGSLVGHALDMGTAGGIWHSGRDNIVGCSGSADPGYLVQAWSHSPSHDEQMRRTDVSTMDVGAALQSGWLFGAVLFH